jgi:hypothetical protein
MHLFESKVTQLHLSQKTNEQTITEVKGGNDHRRRFDHKCESADFRIQVLLLH